MEQKCEAPEIVVVGSSNMDMITYTDGVPKIGETIRGRDFKLGFGGKGANQAVSCARLGAKVEMVTRVGDDQFGRTTAENYAANGVGCAHVTVTSGAPTGVAQITVDAKGRNSIIIVGGANDLVSAADVESARETAIRGAKVVVCQLEIPLAATVAALKTARSEGVLTVMNPAPAPTFSGKDDAELAPEMYEFSDIFMPNETELEAISGVSVSSIRDAEMAARRVVEGFALGARGKAPKAVVVTLGEQGCLYVKKGEAAVHVPVPKAFGEVIKVVDTTGAGDCFIGSLAFFLAKGLNVADALSKANSIAAASVQKHGTQTSYPRRSDLPAALFEGIN